METKILYLILFIPFYFSIAAEKVDTKTIINAKSNHDTLITNLKSKKVNNSSALNVKNINLTPENYEKEFWRAQTLLLNFKTKKQGIKILNKFLYVDSHDYKISAILEMGLSKSFYAIDCLYKKGMHAIINNEADVLEDITSALISLNANNTILNLAKYSKKKRAYSLLNIIRDEYLSFASGNYFERMERVAGKVYE